MGGTIGCVAFTPSSARPRVPRERCRSSRVAAARLERLGTPSDDRRRVRRDCERRMRTRVVLSLSIMDVNVHDENRDGGRRRSAQGDASGANGPPEQILAKRFARANRASWNATYFFSSRVLDERWAQNPRLKGRNYPTTARFVPGERTSLERCGEYGEADTDTGFQRSHSGPPPD